MRSILIPQIGGWLALLVVLHFAVDWVFQSHDEAMRKPREWKVRARHCLVYTFPFAVLLCLASWDPLRTAGMIGLVFLSHFVEDTYVPILLWAKYVRRPPQMRRRLLLANVWMIRESEGCVRLADEKNGVEVRELERLNKGWLSERDVKDAQRALDIDGFISFVSEPLGKILLIAIDQIVHVLFLLPVAYMMAARP